MNAPLYREVLLPAGSPDPQLPLATEGVLRFVWESRFGSMLVEVVGDRVYVNGDLVERHRTEGTEQVGAPVLGGTGPCRVGRCA